MTEDIKDKIIEAALPEVLFDGWIWDVIEKAAQSEGFEKSMAKAVFPDGLKDALVHFADWADRRMLAELGAPGEGERIRDRITRAVVTRFEVLQAVRDAEIMAIRYWGVPSRHLQAGKIVWRTADRIWDWAGDTSTDYNRYTKRGLLSGVIGTTALTWLNDETDDLSETKEFLDRRIENVMQAGKIIGKIKSKVA